MTIADTLGEAAGRLAASSDTPRLDAELLMAASLGVSRSDLLLHRLADAAPPEFALLLARRLDHEPVAYILGVQPFFGLDFDVTPDVLIPRADSEVLVEAALALGIGSGRALDCGTGSGALLLAFLHEAAEATGVGIDRSAAAISIARGNAARLGLDRRATMIVADWAQPGWSAGLGRFDLILANPPYVEDRAEIPRSVRHFEPAGALFAGADGLEAYRALIPQLPDLLAPGGVALVEIGSTQADAVSHIAQAAGLAAALHRDLAGRPRVLELRPMLVHKQ